RVAAINTTTAALAARIPLAGPVLDQQGNPVLDQQGHKIYPFLAPKSVAVTGDMTRAYVSLPNGAGISVTDAQALQKVDVVPSTPAIDDIQIPGSHPWFLAVAPSDKLLFAADGGTFQGQGMVYVVDINPASQSYNHVINTIHVPSVPSGLRGVAVSADGSHLYLTAPDTLLDDP